MIGYDRALDEVIKIADNKSSEITGINIKVLHGYIVGNNKSNPTEYRTGQNGIKELISCREDIKGKLLERTQSKCQRHKEHFDDKVSKRSVSIVIKTL